MSSPIKPEFYKLVRPFVAKLLGSFAVEGSVQQQPHGGKKKYQPLGYPKTRPLTQMDLAEHFFLSPIARPDHVQGSLGVIPPVIDGYLRFVCIDIDDEDLKKEVDSKLIPYFKEKNIPYIMELGGDKLDRCHIWILTMLSPSDAKVFFKNLLEGAGFSLQKLAEVFGINKPRNLIRLPGGAHIWRGGKRFPIEVGYEHVYDPIEIMKAFLNLQTLDKSYIDSMGLGEFLIQKEVKRTVEGPIKTEKFKYQSRNLPIPEGTPDKIAPIFRECQAFNEVLCNTIKETKSHDLGELFHWGALQLQRLGKINDLNKKTEEGREWFESITKNAAHAKTHNWKSNQSQISLNPDRFIPSCNKMETKYGACEGCPFRGSISSPGTFLNNSPSGRTLVEEIGLLTPKEVAENTFLDFRDTILHMIDENKSGNILLASPQGVGKSSLVSRISAELGQKGKKVLIAVNTATVAMEHKARIEAAGGQAFLLMSHKNIFQYLSPFPCPKYGSIQALHRLGVESTEYKKQFCMKCPLLEKCYYPQQYREVHEEKHNVVIIQHAHLQCQEIVWDLIQKNFDILFIDESFIKSCFTFIKPLKLEVEILTSAKYEMFKWVNELGWWLSGDELSKGNLHPNDKSLEYMKEVFDKHHLPWTVPDYIRYYNQRRKVHPISGIEIVYELPPVPRLVLTDATPPVDILKALTGIEDLMTFGRGEVLDIKRINKDNEIIQILDTTTSVTFLEKNNNMENLLFKIGELCEGPYEDKKILFTIYKKHYDRILEFFSSHPEEFPNIVNRIRSDTDRRLCSNPIYLDWMDKGTNEFVDFDVQFLMAGVYYRPDQYIMEMYKINTVKNHFNRMKGYPLINTIYPTDVGVNSRINSEKLRVRRIENIDGKPGLYEYPDYHFYEPEEKWSKLVYHLNIANTQQAIRLRFTPDKPRIVYVLNNSHLPSMVVTKSVLFSDFIKPLEE